jgi:hypothetical protein
MDSDALGVLNALAALRKGAECASKEREEAEKRRTAVEVSINNATKTIFQLKEQISALKKRTERETLKKLSSKNALAQAKGVLEQHERSRSAKIAVSLEFSAGFLEKSTEFCLQAQQFRAFLESEVSKQQALKLLLSQLSIQVWCFLLFCFLCTFDIIW